MKTSFFMIAFAAMTLGSINSTNAQTDNDGENRRAAASADRW